MALPGVPKGPSCKPQEEREPQAICCTHMPGSLSACTSKSIFNLKYTLTFILDLISGLIEPQGSMKQLLFNCSLYTKSSAWAVGGCWPGPAEPHLTYSVYKGCWVCIIASGSRATCEQQTASGSAHIWRGARWLSLLQGCHGKPTLREQACVSWAEVRQCHLVVVALQRSALQQAAHLHR